MYRRTKRILQFSTLVVVAAASASCDNETTTPGGDAIVLGGLFSITGNWATLGVASKAASHLIHHRGQLTVYLRLIDVPLPSIYGPTADERPAGF